MAAVICSAVSSSLSNVKFWASCVADFHWGYLQPESKHAVDGKKSAAFQEAVAHYGGALASIGKVEQATVNDLLVRKLQEVRDLGFTSHMGICDRLRDSTVLQINAVLPACHCMHNRHAKREAGADAAAKVGLHA